MYKNVVAASSLVGELVHSRDGKITGQVEEVLLEAETAQIAYAVISFDKSQGMGNKWIAFPWAGIRMDLSQGGDGLILDVTKEVLKTAPTFTKTDWPNFADPQFEHRINQHFNLNRLSEPTPEKNSSELQS